MATAGLPSVDLLLAEDVSSTAAGMLSRVPSTVVLNTVKDVCSAVQHSAAQASRVQGCSLKYNTAQSSVV
jgi:hypothetical protein